MTKKTVNWHLAIEPEYFEVLAKIDATNDPRLLLPYSTFRLGCYLTFKICLNGSNSHGVKGRPGNARYAVIPVT